MGWHKPAGYFERVLQQQAVGALNLLLALEAGEYLGHCKLVWSPGYPGFRERGIPEIQDLNVIRSRRRQGVASRLLDEAEAYIVKRSPFAGIGFGLYADYGAAQRLYIQRGYVPRMGAECIIITSRCHQAQPARWTTTWCSTWSNSCGEPA